MSSSIGDLLAQLHGIREELPFARAAEFEAALESVSAHVRAVLGTSRHTDGVLNQIHAVRVDGSTAIHEHLQHIDTAIEQVALQL